jgi:hypothetical protein
VVSAYPEVIARLTGEWVELTAQSADRRGIGRM